MILLICVIVYFFMAVVVGSMWVHYLDVTKEEHLLNLLPPVAVFWPVSVLFFFASFMGKKIIYKILNKSQNE